MAYLKKIDTGVVTDFLEPDSPEYLTLVKMRFAAATKIPGTGGFGAGSGGEYTVAANTPIWSGISEEDVGFPVPSEKRVAVIFCNGAVLAGKEITGQLLNPTTGGKITSVFYVPITAVTGAATNYREIILQQIVPGEEAAKTKTEKLAI